MLFSSCKMMIFTPPGKGYQIYIAFKAQKEKMNIIIWRRAEAQESDVAKQCRFFVC